jgi:outer membrane immunogenic protein
MQRLFLACVALCGIAAPAIAADLPIAPYQPVLVRPLYSWTGCSLGVNIGGGAAPQTFTDVNGTFAPAGADLGNHTSRGVVGGWQGGCDYQMGSFVLGLHGLYDLSGMKASNTQPSGMLWNRSFVQTVVTVTGRAGYTVTPTLLVYGKAGGAWVHDLYDAYAPSGANPFGAPLAPATIAALGSITAKGWTAGLGLEWAFGGGDWSAFLEYDFMDFGTSRVTYLSTAIPGKTTFPIDITQKVNLVLLGINYRFWGGGPRF